jgi:large subunit ribosomal protein L3
MAAILGRKLGMTRVFTDEGTSVAVTVVEAGPCVVVDTRTPDRDGYAAVRVAFDPVAERRLSKPAKGLFAKHKLAPHRVVRELPMPAGAVQPGQAITVEVFEAGQMVDVSGTSIGKGFAGAMKRHQFGGQRDSHGVSLMHRAIGSIGSSDIARVFPGKRMPGRHGHKRVTIKRLRVVRVDAKNNLLLLRGAVPGVRGGLLMVRSAKPAAAAKKPAGAAKK